jgi:hypothetical protein
MRFRYWGISGTSFKYLARRLSTHLTRQDRRNAGYFLRPELCQPGEALQAVCRHFQQKKAESEAEGRAEMHFGRQSAGNRNDLLRFGIYRETKGRMRKWLLRNLDVAAWITCLLLWSCMKAQRSKTS